MTKHYQKDSLRPPAVLVFDSGVGGLSIVSHLKQKLPGAGLVYLADTEFAPYGSRDEAEIEVRLPGLLAGVVADHPVDLVVIACNTASTAALDAVRARLEVPVVGTVPAIKPAAALSQTRVIGLLGTETTVWGRYTDRLVAEFALDCRVIRHGAPELVDMAEAKLRGRPPSAWDIQAALAGLFRQRDAEMIDVVVLACTHFPLLRRELEAADTPRRLAWLCSGEAIAARAAQLLPAATRSMPATGEAIFTSDAELDDLRPALERLGLRAYAETG